MKRTLQYVLRLSPVELVSICYATYILSTSHDLWLSLAKYHGMSINVCLFLIYFSISRNVRLALRSRVAIPRCITPDIGIHAHTFYAYRLFFSAIVHSLVHVLKTHPLPPILQRLTQQPLTFVRIWMLFRWTLTGYASLLVFIAIFLTGRRLLRFARRHVHIKTLHATLAHIVTICFMLLHHANYVANGAIATLYIVDTLLGHFLYTTRATVDRVMVFPGGMTDADPTVLEFDLSFSTDSAISRHYRAGDHIFVKIAAISRWQWHPFTLMPGLSSIDTGGQASPSKRLILRCVGSWTKSICDLRNKSDSWSMQVRGPYSNSSSCDVDYLLRQKNVRELVLVCTGTSITHHMSLLSALFEEICLRDAAKCLLLDPNDDFAVVDSEIVPPRRVSLVWIVGSSLDINFALRMLNTIQRRLARYNYPDLLHYHIWVTKDPSAEERSMNQRLQRFLTYEDVYDVEYAPWSVIDDAATSDHQQLQHFYRNCNLTVGSRPTKDNWHDLFYATSSSPTRKLSDTFVLLTSGVSPLKQQISDLSREYGYRLFIEDLW